MSFAIRPTFKPRNLNLILGSGEVEEQHTREETEEIITAIKQFGQKSSHENLISSIDLQSLLLSSSINPDTNPQAKECVDGMLKVKNSGRRDIASAQEELATTHGFSSGSVNRFNNGIRAAKLEQELERELEGIRSRGRKQRGDPSEEQEDDLYDVDEKAEMKAAAHSKAKRSLAYSHPATACMARGFVRQGGVMAGHGIKRVAMGISDAF